MLSVMPLKRHPVSGATKDPNVMADRTTTARERIVHAAQQLLAGEKPALMVAHEIDQWRHDVDPGQDDTDLLYFAPSASDKMPLKRKP